MSVNNKLTAYTQLDEQCREQRETRSAHVIVAIWTRRCHERIRVSGVHACTGLGVSEADSGYESAVGNAVLRSQVHMQTLWQLTSGI